MRSTFQLLAEFDFKIASSREAIDAHQLFESVYRSEVGFVPDAAPDDGSTYLIAHDRAGYLVATLRFRGPDCRPFDFEKHVDLDSCLGNQAAPAWLSRFCIAPTRRQATTSLVLHLGVLRLAVKHARREQISDLVLYTQPHLFHLYRIAFFRPTGVSFAYPPLTRPMHLMALHIDDLYEQLRGKGGPRARVLLSD